VVGWSLVSGFFAVMAIVVGVQYYYDRRSRGTEYIVGVDDPVNAPAVDSRVNKE